MTAAPDRALVPKLLLMAALFAVATWGMVGRSAGSDPEAPVGVPIYSPELDVGKGGFTVEHLVVDHPGPVRLQAVNRDGTRRSVTLSGPGVDRSESVGPGASATLEAKLRSGNYRLSTGGGGVVEVSVGGQDAAAPKR